MATRSRKAASARATQAPVTQPEPEAQAVEWLDTWVKGNDKITLFSFLADNKLCVKVTFADAPDGAVYLNAGDISSYLDEDEKVVRGYLTDASRFGSTVEAGLDSYFTLKGFTSRKAAQAAKQEKLAALGLN